MSSRERESRFRAVPAFELALLRAIFHSKGPKALFLVPLGPQIVRRAPMPEDDRKRGGGSNGHSSK
jgi:hypothetical protein